MKHRRLLTASFLGRGRAIAASLAVLLLVSVAAVATGDDGPRTVEGGDKLFEEKNYLEAAKAYAAYLEDQGAKDPEKAFRASSQRVACLLRLSKFADAEAAAKELPKLFAGKPREARAERFVGNLLVKLPHHGTRQGGTWKRGEGGQGTYVTRFVKDRNEAVAHLERARDLYAKNEGELLKRAERIAALFDLVDAATRFGPYDLAHWPTWYEEDGEEDGTVAAEGPGRRYRVRAQPTKGLAADADGEPIFEPRPDAYDADLSATQKMKFLLHEAAELDETEEQSFRAEALYRRAMLARARYGPDRVWQDWQLRQQAERMSLGDLADDEVLTLVGGQLSVVKLPDDENIIGLLTQLLDRFPKSEGADEALLAMGLFRQGREEFPEALAAYERLVREHPKSPWVSPANGESYRIKMAEVVMNPTGVQLVGDAAILEISHRNVPEITFSAQRIDVERVIRDVLAKIEKDDKDANPWALQNLASWLLDRNRWKSYLVEGETETTWSTKVTQRADRRYDKIEVATPLTERGCWAITASAKGDGTNATTTGFALINDMAVVEKDVPKGKLLWVTDARHGRPIAGAQLEVIEYWQEWNQGDRRSHHHMAKSETVTGDDGTAVGGHRAPPNRNTQLLTIAKGAGGRLAFTGLGWWGHYRPRQDWSGHRAFMLTDRPVYRPEQQVHVKLWVRQVRRGQYAEPTAGSLRVLVKINDPKGQEALAVTKQVDEMGAVEVDLDLAENAPLGMYYAQVQVNGQWAQVQGNQFRVEEYKKPEFEVTVEAAQDQIRLGGEVKAKIVGTYHFGGPVSEGTVKYRVFREPFRFDWTEAGPWDWLYGRGYGRCLYACEWFPWWGRYGWLWGGAAPRELIKTGEGPLAPDGTLEISIDTAPALKDHGDTDHRYVIEAEVRDASRRTISGGGEVMATRQSMYAFLSTTKGWYGTGDTVFAKLATKAPDGSAVEAEGHWSLARVVFRGENGDEIVEEQVERHELQTDEEGRAAFSFETLAAGQYRLSFETKDAWGGEVVGTTLVWVQGPGLEGKVYKFNEIELITDKRSYAPGETARVLARTERPGATMLFADRCNGGVLLDWRTVEMTTRTQVLEITLEDGDVPNRWIEGTIVRGGRVHSEARELIVPPTKGMVDITVTPDKEVYAPGEEGTISISATTPDGEPVDAQVALFAFDEAVLQIQPELTPDIRRFFWGQRRGHGASFISNLQRQMQSNGHAQNPHQAVGFYALPGYLGSMGDRSADFRDADGDELAKGSGRAGGALAFGAERKLESSNRAEAAGEADGAASPGQGGRMRGAREAAAKSPAPASGPVGGVAGGGGGGADDGGEGGYKAATVRKNFADTALWLPSVRTGDDGKATAKVKFPENLTTWQIRGYGATKATRVGKGTAEVLTTKNLLVRLAAPRFFVERDEVVLSAIVMNRLATEKKAKVSLTIPEKLLALFDGVPLSAEVMVPAAGEARVDWRIRAVRQGIAAVTVEALTDEESDAMQLRFPVFIYGADRQVARTGRTEDSETVTFTIPKEIRPEQSTLAVRISPSLAGAMLEALPFLLDYPYGCVEQTLNRFVPAAVTRKTLQDTGVDLDELARTFARLNPQDSDHPTKRRHFGYDKLPVFDKDTLDDIIADGLDRLYTMQHGDGGWGWWAADRSSAYMTALVVDGLLTAQESDVAVRDDVVAGGMQFLKGWLDGELADYATQNEKKVKTETKDQRRARLGLHRTPVQVLATYVLARRKQHKDEVLAHVMKNRDFAKAYGLGLLAIAHQRLGKTDEAKKLLRNLWQRLEKDDENHTAWVDTPEAGWWWWWNNDIETNAVALRALVAIDPESDDAPKMVKWLLNNRRNGFYWRSTRDTAAVIGSFSDYLAATGELTPDMTVKIDWDGGAVSKEVRITRDNIFTFDGSFALDGDALTPGEHTLSISKEGRGVVYWNAYLSYFTQEDKIPASGLEVKVERKYLKLTPIVAKKDVKDARGADMKEDRLRYERTLISEGDEVQSGDLIEVQLHLTSKNDYDYLAFEDPKPAGCEPVALRSGGRYGELCSNMELRDEKTVFFVTWLRQGTHRITYRLRAEVPGVFNAMPAFGYAMYAPEIRGNADSMRMTIVDEPKDEKK